MNLSAARLLLFIALVLGHSAVLANQAPVLKPDSSRVAEAGTVVIDVLANDRDPDGTLSISSMYISSEAMNGYLGIDAKGRISYTHYGGPTTADTFSYVISDNKGAEGRPAVVMITIGDGPAVQSMPSQATRTPPAANTTNNSSTAAVTPAISQSPARTTTTSGSSAASEPVITRPANVIVNGRIKAFHRSGQTFLTWLETAPDDGYHVYRHTQPITVSNLSSATRLTGRWGALGNNTSVNVHGGDFVPDHFVISDLAEPLDDNTGLFVYTTQPGDATTAYYAVTNVRGGRERSLMSMTTPLTESVASPVDVLTVSANQGKGRIYTQFMDYLRWNPTFNGYAYNYAVSLPSRYDPKKQYPLFIELHAYYGHHKFAPESPYGWQVIQIFPADPGPGVGAAHSWWYGYSNSHDYRNSDSAPSSGQIENFTEQRVMRAVGRVAASLNVDVNRIYGSGNSMGASGLLALAMRYGSVITGVYANQPMTDYAKSTRFGEELVKVWGAKSRNLPVVNRGPYSNAIKNVNVGVWDWMNHQQQLVARRGENMGFLMTLHGKLDDVIEWQSQGKPFVQALTQGNTGYTAIIDQVGHTWVGFAAVIESLFGFGYNEHFPYKYPLNLSFPAIQNASGSSRVVPADTGKDTYNMNLEWATPHTRFASSIVDQPGRYEISIRSLEGKQTADITPRRTQQFRVQPGQKCRYQAVDSGRGSVVASGSVTADKDALLTIRSMPVVTGKGTRLTISCP